MLPLSTTPTLAVLGAVLHVPIHFSTSLLITTSFIDYARVIFLNTEVETTLEAALWMEWSSSEPNTDHVVFADYNTTGSGVPSSLGRPSWATALTSSEAADYTLSSALGTTSWIDSDYLM